ncbi:hypothetical protein A2678_01035 [Candidatus Kaiserbacteria bacterium RIFCSPHIGHO2_01_FULL_53_31]|uniref:Fibronectin type-III domain-containing protein n=1 Tax=Candidatus Kaiserbacteria bacterium RIFCSPHIGHO2_01_FULL_53_31 TaxID=1798481 RepID=A0A1F6CIE5_9BACT|nr:MAG: hypothetical protein A2678_01035 [Candidatus Kaiserbacteria bacterium RIFCSPHIGHO2_01_FULL_53_31]
MSNGTKLVIILGAAIILSPVITSALTSAPVISIIPTTVGTAKVAVLLYDFTDSPVDGTGNPRRTFTVEQATNAIFSGEVSNFYREISYGKVTLTGLVYPWERLPRNAVVSGVCEYPSPAEIQSSITAKQIDIAQYDRVIIIAQQGTTDQTNDCFFYHQSGVQGTSPHESALPLSSGGQNYSIQTAFTQSLGYSLEHELGHTFGTATVALNPAHASILDCPPGIVASNSGCSIRENANNFDFLSSPGYLWGMHSNAFFKETFGWLDRDSLLNITQSGTYQISPLEIMPAQASTGKVAAKITLPGQSVPTYYIEYRQPIGVDSRLAYPGESYPEYPWTDWRGNIRDPRANLDGIFIYQKYTNPDGSIAYPQLDMSPGYDVSSSRDGVDRDQVALTQTHDGVRVFYDPIHRVTVGPITSVATDKITFQVALNSAPPAATAPHVITGAPDVIDTSYFMHEGATASDVNGDLASFRWGIVNCSTTCPSITVNEAGVLSGSYAVIPPPFISVPGPGTFTLVLTVWDSTNMVTTASVAERSANSDSAPPTINAVGVNPSLEWLDVTGVPIFVSATSTDTNGISKMRITVSGTDTDCVFNPPYRQTESCNSPSIVYPTEGAHFYNILAYDGSLQKNVARFPIPPGLAHFNVVRFLDIPRISNVSYAVLSPSSVTVSWNTNQVANTQVEYGRDSTYGSSALMTPNPTLVLNHSIAINNLKPNITYHYRAQSTDYKGNEIVSNDNSFIISTTSIRAQAPVVTYDSDHQPIGYSGVIENLGPAITKSFTARFCMDKTADYCIYGDDRGLPPGFYTALVDPMTAGESRTITVPSNRFISVSPGAHTLVFCPDARADILPNDPALCVSTPFVAGPDSTLATLSGTIKYSGPSSKGISGATVRLINPSDSTLVASATTDVLGYYSMTNIPAGTYAASATYAGASDSIDILDAVAVLFLAVGKEVSTVPQPQFQDFINYACDTSDDDTVDINDAIHVLKYTVGNMGEIADTTKWRLTSLSPDSLTFDSASQTLNFSSTLVGDCNGSWPN